jgi:dienelactone hydrolase
MLARLSLVAILFCLANCAIAFAQETAGLRPPLASEKLAGTKLLDWDGDLAARMVDDLHAFADRETAASVARRARHFKPNFANAKAYQESLEPNRARLRKYLGVSEPGSIDANAPGVGFLGELRDDRGDGSGNGYTTSHYVLTALPGFQTDVYIVRPEVSHNVIPPAIILLPDADESPEAYLGVDESQPDAAAVAVKLAQRGFCVAVPRLVNRDHTHSVVAKGLKKTMQPHREFVYRQAFEMGRHVIGYELETIRTLTDYLTAFTPAERQRIAVAGYGEGGLLALYAAALDPRIEVVGVSGYFGPREAVWDEPIYRDVWGQLDEFGDAELAMMIAPNRLIVETSAGPQTPEPPKNPDGPLRVTPGTLKTPSLAAVRSEIDRARRLLPKKKPWTKALEVVESGKSGRPWSEAFLDAVCNAYAPKVVAPKLVERWEGSHGSRYSPAKWQEFLVGEHVAHTQALLDESEYVRKDYWKEADRKSRDPQKWEASLGKYRQALYDDVLGRFEHSLLPHNARSRQIYDTPKYRGYEVVLDVLGLEEGKSGGVWAYGILLVPKDIKEGERRPVVVCQHGLEGRPDDTILPNLPGSNFYHSFAARLAEQGFVTFSPQNPYIGKDRFRTLVRKLHPLKKTLWSIIVPQHEQITAWLAEQKFVDPERIAFYGLSYGGKTAMRVPALVDGYCLSICSGDFNEWVRKCTTVRDAFSYMGTHEYEMFEFDLGHTFNYAEMAYLIAPRPFMVERGHRDGVGVDEWVSYEFAKVRMLYADLKIPERTEIEYFDGPHEIRAVGTFDFLHRHLKWPAASSKQADMK